MKAAILTRVPTAALIDITHEIPPGHIRAAQYLLARSWSGFPDRTVHLVVVDPGVGSPRRAIALTNAGHRFVGPDNGIFTPVLDRAEVVQLDVPPEAAPTFHGRDVFAPAAARLALGESVLDLGRPVRDPCRSNQPEPIEIQGGLEGEVVYVDRFGTLISNLPGATLLQGERISVNGKPIGTLRRTFADVPSGTAVAFVGSGGTIEIGVRDSSASSRLGAGMGAQVRAVIPSGDA
jgi:S-adenosylmethionine hydrolase